MYYGIFSVGLVTCASYLVWKNHVLNARVLQVLQASLVDALAEDPPDQAIAHPYDHHSLQGYLALRQRTRLRLWVGWSLYALLVGWILIVPLGRPLVAGLGAVLLCPYATVRLVCPFLRHGQGRKLVWHQWRQKG